MTMYNITDDMIRELCTLTTRNEAGQHFTQYAKHWADLEAAGMISIHRPMHRNGMSYDESHWTLTLTDAGCDLVEASPELHPE